MKETKVCSKCKNEQSITNFSRYSSYCRPCWNILSYEYAQRKKLRKVKIKAVPEGKDLPLPQVSKIKIKKVKIEAPGRKYVAMMKDGLVRAERIGTYGIRYTYRADSTKAIEALNVKGVSIVDDGSFHYNLWH